MVNKKAEIIRVYLPPDANCLLSVGDHCLRSRHYVNVIVAGKQPSLDYLTIDEAVAHCTRGLGIWEWASNDDGQDPDVVLGCAGDIPTLEALAAAAILRERLPDLRVRFVNVVDLMRLQDEHEHPHGLSDAQFDALFTADRPVIFAYHGYPWLIHRLTYRRANHRNLHVRGYKEEGTTTTPFDMVMLNDMDRYHLVMDVIDRVPGLGQRARRAAPGDGGRAPARARVHARARGRPARGPRLEAAGGLTRVRVLVVNAGSSSLKLRLLGDGDELLGTRDLAPGDDVGPALDALGDADAAGHRIVHGGERFRAPAVIDDAVAARPGGADRAGAAAPAEVAGRAGRGAARRDRGCRRSRASTPPSTPGSRRPRATYALPAAWRERWPLRRYGFHGLSHAWAARRAGAGPRWSPATSARARRWPPSATGAASTRRWASRRSRAW